MVIVGIDAAKDKHDCFIMNSDGEVIFDVFTIPNTLDGFHVLLDSTRFLKEQSSKLLSQDLSQFFFPNLKRSCLRCI